MKPNLQVGHVTGPGWGRREKVKRQERRRLDKLIRQAAESGREGANVTTEKRTVVKVAGAKPAAKETPKMPKAVEAAKRSMKEQMPKLPAGARAGTKEEKLAQSKAPAPAKKKEGPSLGREGSISHLMRKMILERKDNESILKAARKAFPKAGIQDNWPQWYRADMIRKGFPEAKVKAP